MKNLDSIIFNRKLFREVDESGDMQVPYKEE